MSVKVIIQYTFGKIRKIPPERRKEMKRPLPVPFVSAILSLCAVAFAVPAPSLAGQGLIAASDEYVYLTESRQEIIAAWGGTDEALILTEELTASKTTPVIRYIAFPALPTVNEASPEALSRIHDLISKKAPKIAIMVGGRKTYKPAVIGIEPISSTTIAPRSIRIVRIESMDDFTRVAGELMKAEGVKDPAPRIERHRAVVEDCLARNLNYFVFDVVSVGERKVAAGPVLFRFKSGSLFVPFITSSRTPGVSAVDLFLVAPGSPKGGAIPSAFGSIAYKIPEGIDFAKYPQLLKKYNPLTYSTDHPVSFPVSMTERVSLSPAVADAVPGWETKARLAAFRYRGDLSNLWTNVSLGMDDFTEGDFETAERAVKDAGEFAVEAPDEKFNILTAPDGDHFKTRGTDPYTSSAAVDGDPSTPYTLPVNGEWVIDLTKKHRIDGVEIVATVTKPDIVPSKNRLCLYISDTGEFSGEERRLDTCVVRSFTSTMEVDDPSRYAERTMLTDRRFSTRFLKITYPYSESISNLYLFEVIPWGEKQD
jgi:hypothetical protein